MKPRHAEVRSTVQDFGRLTHPEGRGIMLLEPKRGGGFWAATTKPGEPARGWKSTPATSSVLPGDFAGMQGQRLAHDR